MARKRVILHPLTDEELKHVEKLATSRTESARVVERAKILLGLTQGLSNEALSKKLGICINTINKVLKKWNTYGYKDALDDLLRPGKSATITLEAKTWVVHLACQLPKAVNDGPPAQLWTTTSLCNYVRKHCEAEGHDTLKNISRSKIWTILNDHHIKPHRIKYYLVKKDPEFKEKAQQVLLLYKRVEWILQMTRKDVGKDVSASDLVGETVISYDEKPGIQAIMNIAPDLAPTEEYGTVARDYEYKRLGTMSLLAGIDLLSGDITGLVRDSHGSDDFIDFLKHLNEKYSEDISIRMILDNHSVHKSKKVMDYLSTVPNRFTFTFTPKHASWLNLVESFFGKLARKCLRELRVDSKQELADTINKWIDEENKAPVIYRWKWQLDDILGAFD